MRLAHIMFTDSPQSHEKRRKRQVEHKAQKKEGNRLLSAKRARFIDRLKRRCYIQQAWQRKSQRINVTDKAVISVYRLMEWGQIEVINDDKLSTLESTVNLTYGGLDSAVKYTRRGREQIQIWAKDTKSG